MGRLFASKPCPFGLTTTTQSVGVVYWDLYDSIGISYLKDSSLRIGDRICVLFQTEFRSV
jgi:hypothetical protein